MIKKNTFLYIDYNTEFIQYTKLYINIVYTRHVRKKFIFSEVFYGDRTFTRYHAIAKKIEPIYSRHLMRS